jgi:hypothetical protein
VLEAAGLSFELVDGVAEDEAADCEALPASEEVAGVAAAAGAAAEALELLFDCWQLSAIDFTLITL